MTLPPRFLGYGAYNLAHDKYLGKPADGVGPIFFKYLRDGGWPVNLVKVICFRFSGQDELAPARRLALYDPQHNINTSFLDNLSNTVDQARQFGFWVQVCLFSFQSIVGGEQPENAPTVFGIGPPGSVPTDAADSRERIRTFFNANDAARFAEQTRLVRLIADRLRVYPNVLWELANELRISNQDNPPADDNCRLVTWLNRTRTELVRALQGTPALITTSTGTQLQSERFFFRRVAADNCPSPALPVEFFDFHGGQWGAGGDFTAGIVGAKQRAITGTPGAPGYNPSAFLIINDDGSRGAADAATIQQWATTAFRNGLHYAAKQTYPPAKPWNLAVLNALKQAFNT
jgi:hypothetical protein